MRPHTLDEMSTIILIFCRDGANKIELIEKCYLNDIELHLPRPFLKKPPSLIAFNVIKISYFYKDMLLLICRIFYKFI